MGPLPPTVRTVIARQVCAWLLPHFGVRHLCIGQSSFEQVVRLFPDLTVLAIHGAPLMKAEKMLRRLPHLEGLIVEKKGFEAFASRAVKLGREVQVISRTLRPSLRAGLGRVSQECENQ